MRPVLLRVVSSNCRSTLRRVSGWPYDSPSSARGRRPRQTAGRGIRSQVASFVDSAQVPEHNFRSMASRPVHKIRATVCGKARNADTFTALWTSTTCRDCLRGRPELSAEPDRRSGARPKRPVPDPTPSPNPESAQPIPAPPPRDPRVSTTPHVCREGCGKASECWRCGRCEPHCLAKTVNDEAAHANYWATRPEVKVKRKRH